MSAPASTIVTTPPCNQPSNTSPRRQFERKKPASCSVEGSPVLGLTCHSISCVCTISSAARFFRLQILSTTRPFTFHVSPLFNMNVPRIPGLAPATQSRYLFSKFYSQIPMQSPLPSDPTHSNFLFLSKNPNEAARIVLWVHQY